MGESIWGRSGDGLADLDKVDVNVDGDEDDDELVGWNEGCLPERTPVGFWPSPATRSLSLPSDGDDDDDDDDEDEDDGVKEAACTNADAWTGIGLGRL